MSKKLARILLVFACLFVLSGSMAAQAESASAGNSVSAVIAQLEAIDTLEEMQAARSNFTVSGNYSASNAAEHEAAHAGYAAYLSRMNAARMAAKTAYESLSADQKAQIDSALVAKIYDSLETVWYMDEHPDASWTITKGEGSYIYQFASGSKSTPIYELSPHCTAGLDMPQTFQLVDTTVYTGEWQPDGLYTGPGENNYDLAYCCDLETHIVENTHYRRVNLEDSGYYGPEAAKHIRAIVQNSYPFVSIDEMKKKLRSGGLESDVVSGLDRGEIIAAVQMAIWSYSNYCDLSNITYGGTFSVAHNKYSRPLHDFSNESWRWWSPVQNRVTYDPEANYRIGKLTSYLQDLPGVSAEEDELVISNVEILREEPVPNENGMFNVHLRVILNNGVSEGDNVTMTLTSTSSSGSTTTKSIAVESKTTYPMYIEASYGSTITVTLEGTQHLDKGVYYFDPENGRKTSQALVAVVPEKDVPVMSEASFDFKHDIDKGIRLYKSAPDTRAPISGITFNAYHVVPADGETISSIPTEEEILKYAVEANLAGTVTTDENGYGAIALDDGLYLLVEEASDKVEAPASPFYFTVPMQDSSNDATLEIVAVYPKNKPVTPENPSPDIPEPDKPEDQEGTFEIIKFSSANTSIMLAGAKFQVFRPAVSGDSDVRIITCDGIQYSVTPVLKSGEPVILTTGHDGTVTSPSLPYGAYFLVETQAPGGYNRLTEAVSVSIPGYDGDSQALVANEPGTELPATGGSGTAWFYLAGSLLVSLSALLLWVRKRSAI